MQYSKRKLLSDTYFQKSIDVRKTQHTNFFLFKCFNYCSGAVAAESSITLLELEAIAIQLQVIQDTGTYLKLSKIWKRTLIIFYANTEFK
jgi:hypothetical protein